MPKIKMLAAAGTLLLALPALAAADTGSSLPATSLWHGGTILTMDGNSPHSVQAVVERDGKILYAGAEAKARKLAGKQAIDRDLKGATMLPGFVDAHSHFAMAMQVGSGVDLQSPDNPWWILQA